MESPPPIRQTSRLLPAALATLVFATAGVLILLMMIPPSATLPSSALDRDALESHEGEGDGDSSSSPGAGRRTPFTAPESPSLPARADGNADGKRDARNTENPRRPALSGRVVDSESRPLRGATTQLAQLDADGPRNARSRTDDSGEFVVQSLHPGTWRVAATAAGYRPLARSLEIPREEPVELVLEDDPGLEITVIDSSGAAVEGARVALRVRSLSLPGRRSGSTSAEGTVTLSGIPASDAEWTGQLAVSHADFLPLERSINEEDLDRGELRIVLQKGGELRLRILSVDGQPVSGAVVTVSRPGAPETRWLRSVSSGEVHFRNLPPGDYGAIVTTRRQGQASVRGLAVTADSASDPREITLERGPGSLTIRAIAHDGSALPLCRVRLVPSAVTELRGRYREGVTDESGTCRFESIPDTRYNVEVGGGKYTLARESAIPADGRELVVHVDRPGSIAGRVELPQVKGGYTIRITGLRNAAGSGRAYERTVRFSALRRQFTLRYLAPGTYTLDLLVDGKTVATVEEVAVRAGEKTEGVVFGEQEG